MPDDDERNLRLAKRLTHAEQERDRARQRHRDLENLTDRDVYVILPYETWLALCTQKP